MTYIVRWFIYILSYLPLYILLFVKHFQDIKTIFIEMKEFSTEGWFWIFLFSFSLISIIGIIILITKFTRSGTTKFLKLDPQKLQSVRDQEMSYLVTYVVPLSSIQDISEPRNLITNLILFFIIGLMYTKNNMVHLNPFYAIIGLNIFQYENESYVTFMSIEDFKKGLREGVSFEKKNWSSNIFFVKRKVLK